MMNEYGKYRHKPNVLCCHPVHLYTFPLQYLYSIVHVDEKNRAMKHLQVQLQVRGLDPRVDVGGGENHKKHDGEAFELKRGKPRHQDVRERLRYVRYVPRSCSASDGSSQTGESGESGETVRDRRYERTGRPHGLRRPICEERNREMMMALSILRADLRGMARKVGDQSIGANVVCRSCRKLLGGVDKILARFRHRDAKL